MYESQYQVNMSAVDIVSGIVNATIGLLCNKLRDYIAQRLNEGDINDSELKQIIVRELDDIKTKIDGQARAELLASLSFFEEGVTRLYISCEKSSTSQARTEDDESEGAIAIGVERSPVSHVEGEVIDTASHFQKRIGTDLKIASEKRYQFAKKSFENSSESATKAFNNTVLSTEDRVMAGKLRIASQILGCLEDPEAAVHNCLLYLKELQDLPAVQAMFTVWRESERGFISRVRARWNETKRNIMVESIQAINELLLNLTLQHTNMRTDSLNWPTINTGREVYKPILRQKEIMKEREMKRYTEQYPMRRLENVIEYNNCAVTSTGKILSITLKNDGLKITKPNGQCSSFYTIPSENDSEIVNEICFFAVDENDNVYILIEISRRHEDDPTKYKILIIDDNGNKIADRALNIIKKLEHPQMTVTKDGKLVIYCHFIKSMYVCDSTNVEKDYRFKKFTLPLKNGRAYDIKKLNFTVSDQNEIYILLKRDKSIVMHIITMDDQHEHEVQFPENTVGVLCMNVVFNHVNKTILVSLRGDTDRDNISFFIFSKTGELLYEFQMPDWGYHQLTSHPKGPIALVDNGRLRMLQM